MNQVYINHTKRMDATRAFIRQHWEEHHYAPSIKEIATALGVISTSTASYYVAELVETGWLEPREKGTGRGSGAARNIVPAAIFADRPVFPDEFVGPSPIERVLPILHDQFGKMTEFPGVDLATGEDYQAVTAAKDKEGIRTDQANPKIDAQFDEQFANLRRYHNKETP